MGKLCVPVLVALKYYHDQPTQICIENTFQQPPLRMPKPCRAIGPNRFGDTEEIAHTYAQDQARFEGIIDHLGVDLTERNYFTVGSSTKSNLTKRYKYNCHTSSLVSTQIPIRNGAKNVAAAPISTTEHDLQQGLESVIRSLERVTARPPAIASPKFSYRYQRAVFQQASDRTQKTRTAMYIYIYISHNTFSDHRRGP